MTILFDSTRKSKTVRRRRVFAQGVPVSQKRAPYTAADLAWAAENLNQTTTQYVPTAYDRHVDQLAGEAAWYDSVGA